MSSIVFAVLCVVYCFECVCVRVCVCIVVPLPPGTNPFAVKNSNKKIIKLAVKFVLSSVLPRLPWLLT
jgi:hypothetical protein